MPLDSCNHNNNLNQTSSHQIGIRTALTHSLLRFLSSALDFWFPGVQDPLVGEVCLIPCFASLPVCASLSVPFTRQNLSFSSCHVGDSCSIVFAARVIPVHTGSSDLLPVVLEETGGLGVDIVIDSGGKSVTFFTFVLAFYL